MDRARLEYEMAKNGLSKGEMCQRLGISRTAFYRKCRGLSEFTLAEVKKIVSILHLDSPGEIFFADKVS